jgi:hypothetical protein
MSREAGEIDDEGQRWVPRSEYLFGVQMPLDIVGDGEEGRSRMDISPGGALALH